MKISISPDFKILKPSVPWKPGENPELDSLIWKFKSIAKTNHWEEDGAAFVCIALSEWGEIHFGTIFEAMRKLVEIAESNTDYFAVNSAFMKSAKETKK